MEYRLLLVCTGLLLSGAVCGQQREPTGQPIGIRAEGQGLFKNYAYQYAKAEKIDINDALLVVAMHGTDRQQWRAKRLLRAMQVNGMTLLTSMVGYGSAGFFGEPQLQTRRVVWLSGMGLFSASLFVVNAVQDRQARRLLHAYNDTLLTRPFYVRAYADPPYPTLADTVAVTGKTFSYRGMLGVMPTRTAGFDWKQAQPRLGLVGSIGVGLAAVGGMLLSGASIAALQPGDYRQYAWSGAGTMTIAFTLASSGRSRTLRRQLDAIERYNQRVRERTLP